MKRAEEYVNDFWGKIPETCLISEYDIKLVIKYAQIDAIKETCQACSDNCKINDKTFEGFFAEIDYSSILEVADKLIKELK